MNLHGIQTILLSALGVAASSAVSLAGCGGSFDVPKDHFDGVDEFGYVSYWDKIADIDIGEDAPLPLVIGFKSNRDTSSPYLGHGWVMPLLESYMIQTGENTFEIMKPTGYTSGFGRDPRSPTTIGGVKGWKGEIGSNTIKVWAPCGWSLTYTLGRLTEMATPKGKKMIVKRDQAGQVEDVTMDGRVLVKVVKGLAGKVGGLEVEGKKYDIALGEKPRIQSIQGKNLIIGKDLSLSRISTGTDAEGFQRGFDYETDGEIQPKMAVMHPGAGKREIVWNSANGIIKRDGEWVYDINRGLDQSNNAAIGRKNSKNQSEFWHRDGAKGEEIVQGVDGFRKVTSWFTSGKLAGKIRMETVSQNTVEISSYKASYDERSRLVREHLADGATKEYGYLNDGNRDVVTIIQKDKSVTVIKYRNGEVIEKNHRTSSGVVSSAEYFENGLVVRRELPGKRSENIAYVPGTSKVKEILWSDGTSYENIYGDKDDLIGCRKNGKLIWHLISSASDSSKYKVFLSATDGSIEKITDLLKNVDIDPKALNFRSLNTPEGIKQSNSIKHDS